MARAWGPVALLLIAMAGLGQLGLASAGPTGADKVAHVVEFLLLAALVTRALRVEHPGGHAAWIALGAVLFALGVGALDEAVQAWQPSRVSDWRDLGADALGAIAGAALGALIYRAR